MKIINIGILAHVDPPTGEAKTRGLFTLLEPTASA